jgi:hypothetical protein
MGMGKVPPYIPAVAMTIRRWQGTNTSIPHLQTQTRHVTVVQIVQGYSDGSDFRH